jgi:hypothetical protein
MKNWKFYVSLQLAKVTSQINFIDCEKKSTIQSNDRRKEILKKV